MRFASADHSFEPACDGVRGQVLLVAFSAQGPGPEAGPVAGPEANLEAG